MIKIESRRDRRVVALLGGMALTAALTAAGGITPAFADTPTTGTGVISWHPQPEPDLPHPGEAER